jgi:hypothetical protein
VFPQGLNDWGSNGEIGDKVAVLQMQYREHMFLGGLKMAKAAFTIRNRFALT